MRGRARILGIDPGSRVTGWGLVEAGPGGLHAVAWGSIRPAEGPLADRLLGIRRGIEGLLSAHRPATVVIESLFHHKNARSALLLGHVRGVLLVAARESGALIAEYSPAEVKKAVTGYGRAEKGQIQQMVRVLLALEALPRPADAADALALTLCHAARMRLPLSPRAGGSSRREPPAAAGRRPAPAAGDRPRFRRKPRG